MLGAMLIDALHAPLEDREEAFNCVAMNLRIGGINILATVMRGGAVRREMPVHVAILAAKARHYQDGFRKAPYVRTGSFLRYDEDQTGAYGVEL